MENTTTTQTKPREWDSLTELREAADKFMTTASPAENVGLRADLKKANKYSLVINLMARFAEAVLLGSAGNNDRIIVEPEPGHENAGLWRVSYNGKYADKLGFDEMLGLFVAISQPTERRCLQWLKTPEQHRAQKAYFDIMGMANRTTLSTKISLK